MLIVGARLSHPDPRLNVGFREGTVIGAGEGMDDAVRLVYSGGALTPDSASTPLGLDPMFTCLSFFFGRIVKLHLLCLSVSEGFLFDGDVKV